MRQHSLYDDGAPARKRRGGGMRCAMGLPYRPSWRARAASGGCFLIVCAMIALFLVAIYKAGATLAMMVTS